jgi:hypothetical protein
LPLSQTTSLKFRGSGETSGSSLYFDPSHPEGQYVLDLSHPPDFQVATTLCRLDQASPSSLLKGLKLNSKPVAGVKESNWPDKYAASSCHRLACHTCYT